MIKFKFLLTSSIFIFTFFFVFNANALKIDLGGDEQVKKLDKSYSKIIKQFCKELKKDGRALEIGEVANKSIDGKSTCPVCNDFFLKVKVFCAVNKPLFEKKKHLVQREPSLAVVYLTSNLFYELANNEDYVDSGTKISMILSYSLRQYEPMTKGAKEYYDILLKYIEAPFEKSYRNAPSAFENNEKNKKEIFDSLFGK